MKKICAIAGLAGLSLAVVIAVGACSSTATQAGGAVAAEPASGSSAGGMPAGAPAGAPPMGGAGLMPGGGPSSVDTSGIARKWLDVAYASTSASQKLDIYLPDTGDGPFPVIVSIHGGAFKPGNRKSGALEPMLAGRARG